MAIDDNCELLKQLVRTGMTNGYVLWKEIDELPPAGYEGGPKLDDILSELEINGIRVREEPKAEHAEEVNKKAEFLDENDHRELSEQAGGSQPVQLYLREVLAIPRLTHEKEIELAARFSRGGQDAEEAGKQLIETNLWAVVATANGYRNRGIGMPDLLQEGNIGLMMAAKKFNYARGYRFSTYAIWWVRQTILRLILGRE